MKSEKENKDSTALSHTRPRTKSQRATLSIYGWSMKKTEYIKTMQRINEQIAKYLENGFTELNPRQHMFELIGWRNLLTRKPDKLKEFKKSRDEYKLQYVGNLREFLEIKGRIWNTKTSKNTMN